MFYRLQALQPLWRHISISTTFPYISLLVWTIPLLLFSSGDSSVMAHDEGLYAWRSRQMFDSGDWIAPWGNAHHKTPGPYWLIAAFYNLLGISEFSTRLPSMITGILCLLLTYEIGKIMLGKKLAWLAGAILSVEFLWLQYCRLGTPDVPMIFLVLLTIYAVIKSELHPQYRYIWSFIAGLSLGLGFLMRSFMIFLPAIALLPYLVRQHRRYRHLTNPCLYVGLLVGLMPTLIWLWFNWQRYGNNSFAALFGFVFELGSQERAGNGIIFYVWNIPLKAFPWLFFSLLGLFLVVRRPIPNYQLILVGFPVILFAELSVFSTRLSHYSLTLYPFIAWLAAVGLDWLSRIYQMGYVNRKPILQKGNIPRTLSYGSGVLAILFLLAAMVAFAWGDRQYAIIGLIVGLSWLILPIVWISRYHFGCKFLTARYWVAGWLIPCWLALALVGGFGLLNDYNPVYRTFLQQPAIASILQTHPIHFVQLGGKNAVLLRFYTPTHGQKVETIAQLPAPSYAWVYQQPSSQLSRQHRIIGEIQDYKLIQILPSE
ncbi:PMT family glycosyltransferase, 4-amino-4-deoxy-L-arabinose transferase [Nostoc sp. PCC 7524]|uniref:ArnT family glycosyltransferase n=1 Tax=Nostoc sp. (strain ATCC 29411 / PCC 7524) TaxID=28072 RepID=UPI00029EFB30|nr:glycosyltransferase family 39 protein [Nostoc sp. PCC 7524]AFY46742.1 PMT family glycosyltransferase, 4-amino-4-deoxy-L-arabinose transferase [Nostoc sp. PCC 7524]